MAAYQFCKMLYTADLRGETRFVSMQNHYNLLYREEEREMMALCQEEGIGVIPWSPLARGRVTRPWEERGSTDRAETDAFGKTLYAKTEESDREIIGRVERIAAERAVPMAQVALAWMLSKPFVASPIIGATKMKHLEDAAAALELKLTAEEVAALEAAYTPRAVAGFFVVGRGYSCGASKASALRANSGRKFCLLYAQFKR